MISQFLQKAQTVRVLLLVHQKKGKKSDGTFKESLKGITFSRSNKGKDRFRNIAGDDQGGQQIGISRGIGPGWA
jgi:hypothetical protein